MQKLLFFFNYNKGKNKSNKTIIIHPYVWEVIMTPLSRGKKLQSRYGTNISNLTKGHTPLVKKTRVAFLTSYACVDIKWITSTWPGEVSNYTDTCYTFFDLFHWQMQKQLFFTVSFTSDGIFKTGKNKSTNGDPYSYYFYYHYYYYYY